MTFDITQNTKVVRISTGNGIGTGVIIGDHTILTASHVVYNATTGASGPVVSIAPGVSTNSAGVSIAPGGLAISTSMTGYDLTFNRITTGIVDITDFAIFGTSFNLSQFGKMTLASGGSFTDGAANVTGYPRSAGQAQALNAVTVTQDANPALLTFVDSDVNSGNSGGPVWRTINGVDTVVGIVVAQEFSSSGAYLSAKAIKMDGAVLAAITAAQAKYEAMYSGANSQTYSASAPTLDASTPLKPTGVNMKYGTAGNDSLTGTDLRESFVASNGSDTFNGSNGFDVAIYGGKRSNYTVSVNATGATILKTGSETGTDTLVAVERAIFSDGQVDLTMNGDAAKAYRLYQAAFARTPDQGGLDFWVNQLASKTLAIDAVSKLFATSAEFIAAYGGANPSTNVVVDKFYRNVLGRAGEDGGFTFWTNEINTGHRDVANVLAAFSESPENQANLTGVLQNGVTLSPFA
jgi:V8-like Glu-specific endopeptidase